MPHSEDIYLSLDSSVPKRWSTTLIFKVAAPFVAGACVGLLATSVSTTKLASTSAATSTDLMSTMSRPSSMILASLPGNRAWKELALSVMEAGQGCHDMKELKSNPRITAAMANMKKSDMTPVVRATRRGTARGRKTVASPSWKRGGGSSAEDLKGAYPPLGFWDPAGLSTDISPGRLAYYREAELKHGRVCMSSTLGILVAEKYHPLFGGEVDVPAVGMLKSVELTYFWPALLALAGGVELVAGFKRIEFNSEGQRVLKEGLIPGDIGYDPLGLQGTFSEEDDIEGKELLNGRLAMVSLLGIIAQELVFPDIKVFGGIGSFS